MNVKRVCLAILVAVIVLLFTAYSLKQSSEARDSALNITTTNNRKSLGIKYIKKEFSKEEIERYFNEFKKIVTEVCEEYSLDINKNSGIYGHMSDSDIGIKSVFVHKTENESDGNSIYISVTQKIDFSRKFDIKGSIFDTILKRFISDDIDYNGLNKVINGTYEYCEKADIPFGLLYMDKQVMIVNDVVIEFYGIDKDELVMNVGKKTSSSIENVYSYNENEKGVLNLDVEELNRVQEVLMPSYKSLLLEWVQKEERINKHAIKDGKRISTSIRYKDNLVDTSLDSAPENNSVKLELKYHSGYKNRFDITTNPVVIDHLNLIFDNLDYNEINRVIKNRMEESTLSDYANSNINYVMYFPKGVELRIDWTKGDDLVIIRVCFGENSKV